MQKRTIGCVLLAMAFSHAAQAADSHSNCGHFHLQISNMTSSVCVLTSEKINHGNIISSPPMTIMPNDSKVFDMEQTGFGPSITLSYQCGNEHIAFTSKQDLCFLQAGNITGTILDPLPVNINASYTAFTGSYFWNKPGNINWKIIEESGKKITD